MKNLFREDKPDLWDYAKKRLEVIYLGVKIAIATGIISDWDNIIEFIKGVL